MTDNYKKILDEKIALAKKLGKPISAFPLMKYLSENVDTFTDEERKEMCDKLEKSATEVGLALLDRALSDGTLNDTEWQDMVKLGFNEKEMATILQGFYARKDDSFPDKIPKGDDRRIIIISMPDYPQYIHRKLIKDKFDVEVISPEEATKFIEKNQNEDIEFLKHKTIGVDK